jgi:hypothetical protein
MNAVALLAMTDRPMDAPAEAGGASPLLTVQDLRVAYPDRDGGWRRSCAA